MRMQHRHKGRTNYQQHEPSIFCINRTLIQKRLLVEFSYELPTLYLLKRFTHYVVIGLCDQWLLQHKLYVIKVSPKSDMSIVQMNIQNVQSGSKIKSLINQCFNVGNYITTIKGTNMNPGVPQYKNCQRQSHTTVSCRIQGARYIKCSSPHKTEHYHQFGKTGWCYKANDKVNPP